MHTSQIPVTSPASNPIPTPLSRLSPLPKPEPLPEDLDVRIFFGAGIYASDSFRIYSDLLPGRGAPEKEEKWAEKWERARGRWRARGIGKRDERVKRVKGTGDVGYEGEEDIASGEEVQGDVTPGVEVGVEELAGWISDEEGDDSADEWRKVRPTGKSRSTCGQSSESSEG